MRMLLLGWMIFLWAFHAQPENQTRNQKWDGVFDQTLRETSDKLSQLPAGEAYSSKHCTQFYDQFFSSAHVRVTLALGYMDIPKQNERTESDEVLALSAFNSLSKLLKKPCKGSLKLCDFKQRSPNEFVKSIKRIDGETINVSLSVLHSAASSSNYENTWGAFVQKQKQQSEESERRFLNSIERGDDLVVYMGHARSGGGPDFFPPILLENGHANYKHYRQKQEGIKDLLQVIKDSFHPPQILGLLACKSTSLFASRVERVYQNLGEDYSDYLILTASDLFYFEDAVPTGYAIADSLLNERCGIGFERAIKSASRSAEYLNVIPSVP